MRNGKELEVDNVVVFNVVEPNTKHVEKCDLEMDYNLEGFVVNTELQAIALNYKWIAGDCVYFYTKLGGSCVQNIMTKAQFPDVIRRKYNKPDIRPDVGYEAIERVDLSLPTVGISASAIDEDNLRALVTSEGIRSNLQSELAFKKSKKLR